MTDLDKKVEKSSPLRRAMFALEKMQAKLDAMESARTEPVAIIGMGCRLPGGGDNPDGYWQLLRDGVDAVTEMTPERWDIDAWFDPDPNAPQKTRTRHGSFLPEIDRFDPQFFGISSREAKDMDPGQRLLLEVAWEALENANQPPDELIRRSVGVFVGGIAETEYGAAMTATGTFGNMTAYTFSGGDLAFLAGRLSYVLGLQGPSFSVDTACSSSLVAIHLACQSLRSGECELALAGGVNLAVGIGTTISMSQLQALSPDGRCKTFDAAGDGYGRGEGCGVIVLKRLSDAMAGRDDILALIRGSAINHDGPSSGLTVPSRLAQEKVIRQALKNARVDPSEVDYVEAHGTGTPLGDPIEMEALGAIFAENHSKASPLIVGSAKTNFGHLEPAAGVAGLMKIVLALRNEEIPPHLHFMNPSPYIDWENLPFRVPVERMPWLRDPEGRKKRIASVSSFGASGTNAHVVLEEAPAVEDWDGPANPNEGIFAADPVGVRPSSQPATATFQVPERPFHLLALSARSEEALREQAKSYEKYLAAHPEIPFADICFTAGMGRSHFEHRIAVVAGSSEEARARLWEQSYVTGQSGGERSKTVFLFTGQGSEYPDMGRGLYETEPVFRETIDRCHAILHEYDVPLLALLYPEEPNPEIRLSTDMTWLQPVLFALEYALAELWQSWGVKPDVVMGHSIGEYVAACVAGVFSPEDGLKLVAARGRLMQACPEGRMLAVSVSEEKAREIVAPFAGQVSVATINAPGSVVLSGKPEAISRIQADLAGIDGIDTKLLPIPRASHSPLMEPMLAEFQEIVGSVALSRPRIPLCSNVTGEIVADMVTDPGYWTRHLRQPVRFAKSVRTLYGQGFDTFLEIGPRPALLGMAGQCLPDDADTTRMGWIPSLREGENDGLQLLQGLGQWYARGGKPDWRAVEGGPSGAARRPVRLPTYPFQRSRYWLDAARFARQVDNHRDGSAHPLLGRALPLSGTENIHFQSEIGLLFFPWLTDHRVFDVAVLPATGYLEMALAAGAWLSNEWLLDGVSEAEECPSSRITNIAIEQALILPEEEPVTVQLVLSSRERGYDFKISSLDAGNRWTVHVSGGLVVDREIQPPAALDLATLRAQCPTEIAVADHYRNCHEQGLNYGPGFQVIKQIFRGEGAVLGLLELPESLAGEIAGYRLHPALFDAAFQTLPALLPSSEETYLPIVIGEARYYRTAGVRLWSFARVTHSDEKTLVADIVLFDESGRSVAEVDGITIGHVEPETLRRHFKKQSEELYAVAWREHPWREEETEVAESLTGETGSWLILADSGGFGQELATRLEEAGNRCVLAYAETGATVGAIHESPLHDGNTYTLDPADPAAFHSLFQEAFPPDAPPLRGIVFLWALDAPNRPDLSIDALVAAQHLVLGGSLHLLQALLGAQKTARIWLVTRNGIAAGFESEPLSVTQAPLWGMGRTIASEHPELWGGLIDGPTVDRLLTEIGIGLADGEREGTPKEAQIVYRNGKRYVPRLIRSDPPPEDTRPPLRPDASYLITGGLGGLGLMVARYLVEAGARNLVLTARRGPSDEAKEVLRALEEAGARVLVASADVTDRERMALLFREIAEQMPPLGGIIHTAGFLDDGVLREQTLSRFDSLMAPKVTGGWILHTLTRDLPLDFFVCFSSVAALLGSAGQSNYVAANVFLDALAHHRHALGLPALSLDWGSWSKVGLTANLEERDQKRLNAIGIDLIEPEHGVLIMGRLMGRPENIQVTVSPTNWQRFLKRFSPVPGFYAELAKTLPRHASVSFADELKALPPEKHRKHLFAHIQSELNGVLGFEPSQAMDPNKGFTDMGMDSLMIVESRNRLQTSLKNQLPSTLLFEYSSLERLVGYIADEVLNLAPPEELSDEAEPALDAPDMVVNEVRHLSEEDLEALINGELEL
uniref:Acyl transferase domain-containing protein n=1 Tax=Candidatus Kentrum sp. DK TaxID=2126562 RepID=A0A450RV29_9GAMM|nr:MAG: Acyl transferase domain-containing protein [Candidatus Kentron sp. DK]